MMAVSFEEGMDTAGFGFDSKLKGCVRTVGPLQAGLVLL